MEASGTGGAGGADDLERIYLQPASVSDETGGQADQPGPSAGKQTPLDQVSQLLDQIRPPTDRFHVRFSVCEALNGHGFVY